MVMGNIFYSFSFVSYNVFDVKYLKTKKKSLPNVSDIGFLFEMYISSEETENMHKAVIVIFCSSHDIFRNRLSQF